MNIVKLIIIAILFASCSKKSSINTSDAAKIAEGVTGQTTEDGSSGTDAIVDSSYTISISANDKQTGVVGARLRLPFIAVIKDAEGNPVAGVSVTWALASGTGTLADADSSVTAEDGTVSSGLLTLGTTTGVRTVTASIESGTTKVATFTATGIAGLMDSISISANNNQTGVSNAAVALPLVAIVKDAHGNPVAGAKVTWAVTSGGGTLTTAPSSVTAANGTLRSGILTLGISPGINTVTATIASGRIKVATFTATGTLGAPTKLAFIVNPSDVNAASAISPSIKVGIEDQSGNLITTATDTITLTIDTNPSTGVLGGTVSQAAVAGVATFADISINNLGSGYSLRASAIGLTAASSPAFHVTGILSLVGPTAPISSSCALYTLFLRDGLGNPLPAPANTAIGLDPDSYFVTVSDPNYCSSTLGDQITSATIPSGESSTSFYLRPEAQNNTQLQFSASADWVSPSLLLSDAITVDNAPGVAGTLDTSFNGTGKATTNGFNYIEGAVLQQDGKIIGFGRSTGADFKLVRFNSNGSLDTTFATTGTAITDLGGAGDIVVAVVIQQDGKIVAAGDAADNNVGVVRYNYDGSLDTSFGTGGTTTIDFGGSDNLGGAAIQKDGKIVLAGTTYAGGKNSVTIVRLDGAGSLDTSFGTSGKTITNLAGLHSTGNALAINPNGQILVTGWAYPNASSAYNALLLRYNSDGSLDTTFATNGYATAVIGYQFLTYGMVLQPDSKVIAGGSSYTNGDDYLKSSLIRFNGDGSLDTAFGTGGKVTTECGISDAEIFSLALQADGKLITAGDCEQAGTSWDFFFVRYNGDGSLDTSFGTGGKSFVSFGGIDDAQSVSLQQDGKIIGFGNTAGGDKGFVRIWP